MTKALGQSPITPVILSGGSGTRLWPLSRAQYPKQLLPLLSDRTMLQETALRVAEPGLFGAPVVIGNEAHRFVVAEQLMEAGVSPRALVLEPAARNTAPAAAVAALIAGAEDRDALVLLMPSDHCIGDRDAFLAAVKVAAGAAAQGAIVCFSITADRPETGYGWIKRGAALAGAPGAYQVERFREKPPRAEAEALLAEGGWGWNGGLFLFRAGDLITELQDRQPGLVEACRQALGAARRDLDFLRLEGGAFGRAPSISLDHAVMEVTRRAATVPAAMGWSDVGAFAALWEVGAKDAAGNVAVGDVLVQDSTGCYLRSDGPLLAAVGLAELVVVAAEDAVLVAPRGRDQEVKALVEHLKALGRTEADSHPIVYRPWGHYRSLAEGDRFQVKELLVKPGGRLSLQFHHHRAEHWVVVQGQARVVRGDETHLLAENQSLYIPVGMPHRLENPGSVPLRLIEVQSGGYLGEDDIVRLADDYGRKDKDT